jgi:hypothetical protein
LWESVPKAFACRPLPRPRLNTNERATRRAANFLLGNLKPNPGVNMRLNFLINKIKLSPLAALIRGCDGFAIGLEFLNVARA